MVMGMETIHKETTRMLSSMMQHNGRTVMAMDTVTIRLEIILIYVLIHQQEQLLIQMVVQQVNVIPMAMVSSILMMIV